MTERVECIVVGAGVIGLAVARALALAGREVLVLEGEEAIGTGTSSRNSEVVHAGIYYPPGSLKARLCVAGRHALYAYCESRGVTARRVGKLIVATDESQTPVLRQLEATARRNGVDDLVWLGPEAVAALEPQVRSVRALHSPSSGIVDSHGYMLALQGDLENAGGMIAFRAPIEAGHAADGEIVLEVGGAEPMTLCAALVVNAAGLHAPSLARMVEGMPARHVPPERYAKGNYYSLVGVRSPFRHLIYPVPEQAGLGIHATLDLGGQVRFGPDVEWVDRVDYTVSTARAEAFYAAIRAYWPGLPDGALQASYAGIRPKIVGPGEPAADFVIQGPEVHGVPGLINLFGIESPGLTASLAIADYVEGLSRGERAAA